MPISILVLPHGRPTDAEQDTNLPVQLTSFIGREQERALARKMLLQEGVRLLTLTGPPGIGKTRLSLQVAQDILSHFPDGLYFVPLAPIADPSLVLPAIAQALHIRESARDVLLETLKEYLGHRQVLLVLDNFEQVVRAGPLVNDLLAACLRLKVLVTSRQALRVTGEQEFPVPSLKLPEQADYADVSALSRYEAVSLFAQRARAVKPDFTLTGKNASAVARICIQLDGLPLAIELAAARVKLFPPQAMLLQLAHGLSMLTGGVQDLPARQRTLRSAIAWSYDLLRDEEKILFRRLGVFAGGCTLEAAEAVCSARGKLGLSTLEGLALLIDKSLLKPEFASGEDQEPDIQGEPRFMMLETIKQFAQGKLEESGEVDEIRRQHALYFLSLAEQAQPQFDGPQQAKWLERFALEHDDFRAALELSLHSGTVSDTQTHIGLRMAYALARFWQVRGYLTEGREWLSRMLATPESQERTMLRARALARAGEIAYAQSDYAATRALVEESLAICREIGDKLGVAIALDNLGEVATEEGDYVTAPRLFEEGLGIARELGDIRAIANFLIQLGWAAMRSGDYSLAVTRLGEALTLCRRVGDPSSEALALSGLGEAMVRIGNYEQATQLLQESLEIRRELGHRWGIATALGTVAWAALRQVDYERAAAPLMESILIRKEIGDKGGIAWCLERFAEIAKGSRQSERATHLFGSAQALRETVNSVIDPADQPEYERTIVDLRSHLGEEAFALAWQHGRTMSVEQAIAYAQVQPIAEGSDLEAGQVSWRSSGEEDYGGLTKREREIATLIAQSKSNGEIAEELVISKRTVETHITNILFKLGFTSRGQIAAWAIKKGLLSLSD